MMQGDGAWELRDIDGGAVMSKVEGLLSGG